MSEFRLAQTLNGLSQRPLDGAAGNFDAFTAPLTPDLVRTIDPHVASQDAFNLRSQHLITLGVGTAQNQVAPPRSTAQRSLRSLCWL